MALLNILGISSAYAAASAPPQSFGEGIMSMLPILVILVLFMYFAIIRPQTKRAKEQKSLVNSLNKGDEVLTTSGILGKIEKLGDEFVVLKVANEVSINIQKPAIVSVVPKGTIKSID